MDWKYDWDIKKAGLQIDKKDYADALKSDKSNTNYLFVPDPIKEEASQRNEENPYADRVKDKRPSV